MKLFSAVLGLVLAACAVGHAQTNVIVNVTGNNGTDPCNSTTIGSTTGFEVTSYSLGGTAPVSSAGTGAITGKITLADLVVAKTFNNCSGELTKLFLTGKAIPTLTLYDYKTGSGAGAFDFLTITLTDAIITSYSLADNSSNRIPQETIAFDFAKVCITTNKQSATGATASASTVCYDKSTNLVA